MAFCGWPMSHDIGTQMLSKWIWSITLEYKQAKSFFLNPMVKMVSKQNTTSSQWHFLSFEVFVHQMRLKTEDDKYGKDSIGRSLGDLLD